MFCGWRKRAWTADAGMLVWLLQGSVGGEMVPEERPTLLRYGPNASAAVGCLSSRRRGRFAFLSQSLEK